MPCGINLICTLLAWAFLLIILLSNRQNKINQWLFISGMIFSLGVFKEYLFFDLNPYLSASHLPALSAVQSESLYSVLTAVLYLAALPSAMIFGHYFSDKKVKGFVGTSIIAFAAAFAFLFNPVHFRQYQLNSRLFWVLISIYNLTYGILLTVMLIRAVLKESTPSWRGQKRRAAVLVLPLLWYWLITIFVIHTLNLKKLFHVWEGSAVLLLLLLGYYVVMAFREGIMGIKLETINYKWGADVRTVQQGLRYMNHFLKNEVAKIEWCSSNLAAKTGQKSPEEFEIISRSVERLKRVINKTQLYSKDILLSCGSCNMYELVENCILDAQKGGTQQIRFMNHCPKQAPVVCDSFHITEVLNNLFNNAADALPAGGTITVGFDDTHKKYSVLSVSDNGHGIQKEDLPHLFEPYFTSRGGDGHFGLGLFYCYRVMQKLGGKIEVQSEAGQGATFFLYFPKRRGLSKKTWFGLN